MCSCMYLSKNYRELAEQASFFVCVYVCTNVCMQVCVCLCMYVGMYVFIYLKEQICMSSSCCMHVSKCICIYAYTHFQACIHIYKSDRKY
jgi:hypothetical protein